VFGDGNYYLEIQDHGIPEQKQINPDIVRLSMETGIPLVATNDTHYTLKEDADAHDLLLCIQTQTTVDDPDRMSFQTQEFYLKSPDEMSDLFSWRMDAVDNTNKIAEMCNVEFDFSSYYLPKFTAPEGTNEEYLRKLCYNGLVSRYGADHDASLVERLEYELSTITSMGYTDYFLIVWDFIRYARENSIEVGPGRGSGAGSLVAYCLYITGIDPIKYNLIFERFLNPDRISMPDFDIDFCYERRQEVIDYVIEKYGADHVAQIITFGTMAARAAIRDCGRALNMSYSEVDQVAKQVPMQLGITIDRALELNPQLAQLCETDERVRRLVAMARRLEGLPRHASTHAAGVIITRDPVTEYVPLNRNGDIITTQFPMEIIEQLGLLKMDFLGLRTLTVIRDAIDMVKENRNCAIDFDSMEYTDNNIYKLISSGETDGIFQLESSGMRSFLKELKPTTFEDIIAGISLYRPGPMDFIPKYIQGKHNPGSSQYDHPLLKKSLEVTYGCMVYQEQVMQVVRDLAGYSLGRSDLVRRAMAKKKHDVMVEERKNFVYGLEKDGKVVIPGAVRNGVDEKTANKIFDDMMDFANYAFNKSHAAAYAVVAYRTAYLKYYYPEEFMAATMNSFMDSSSKIAQYINYCRRKNIKVLPPDINSSGWKFTVEDQVIRFGLGAIKNVGRAAVESIIADRRQNGKYKDLFDFCGRCVHFINKRMLESLIKAGAFDFSDAKRAQMLSIYEQMLEAEQKNRQKNINGQISLFGMEQNPVGVKFTLPDQEEYELRALLAMEKEIAGVYISGHPLLEFSDVLDEFTVNSSMFTEDSIGEEGQTAESMLSDGQMVEVAGIVAARQVKNTRSNEMMSFITLEDLHGSLEVIVFPRQMRDSSHLLSLDSIIRVKGKVSRREGENAKLVAESITKLTQGQSTRKLFLKVPGGLNDMMLELITIKLKQFPGASRVILYDEASKKSFKLGEQLNIRADNALLSDLMELLGSENVVYN